MAMKSTNRYIWFSLSPQIYLRSEVQHPEFLQIKKTSVTIKKKHKKQTGRPGGRGGSRL